MSDKQVIGVFDSGVGGLSVLAHIRQRLPYESLVYVADSKYMPYGCKPEHVIEQRCMEIADFFDSQHCKAMVVACNTATAAAVHTMRATYSFPVIGMEPALKPAVQHSKSKVVGVLATRGTLGSNKFNRLASRFSQQARVIVQPCPGLVERIEAGDLTGKQTRTMLTTFLQPLMREGVDTLVLGCTHYPFIMPLIREITGDDICLMESGDAIARELEKQLRHRGLLSTHQDAPVAFWSSADGGASTAIMSRLWGDAIMVNQLPF